MSLVVRKPGFPTKSYTNRAVQPQKVVRSLKFRIKEVEGLYNPCSENKGADQLRGYREADLRLCFRKCKKPVFSRRGSNRSRADIDYPNLASEKPRGSSQKFFRKSSSVGLGRQSGCLDK